MSEFTLHKAIVAHLNILAKPGVIYYHPANGEARSPRTGAKLKAMGVLAGTPDLCFLLPSGQSAFMEVKGPKGRLSETQKTFFEKATSAGAMTASVKDIYEALDILKGWGVIRANG